jgi:molybdopterin-guanine dinucleotide biosynthesis protein A
LEVVGGKRILDRVVEALRPVVSELVLISNAPGAGEWIPDVAVAPDVRAERSSLTGIHTALSYAGDAVLVVAWDMPFLSSAALSAVVSEGVRAQYAAVPVGSRGDEPLCAVYRPAALPMVEAALDAGDFRLSNLIARLPHVDRIPAERFAAIGDVARLFFNVNDVQNLEAARHMADEA